MRRRIACRYMSLHVATCNHRPPYRLEELPYWPCFELGVDTLDELEDVDWSNYAGFDSTDFQVSNRRTVVSLRPCARWDFIVTASC